MFVPGCKHIFIFVVKGIIGDCGAVTNLEQVSSGPLSDCSSVMGLC